MQCAADQDRGATLVPGLLADRPLLASAASSFAVLAGEVASSKRHPSGNPQADHTALAITRQTGESALASRAPCRTEEKRILSDREPAGWMPASRFVIRPDL